MLEGLERRGYRGYTGEARGAREVRGPRIIPELQPRGSQEADAHKLQRPGEEN